MGSVGNLLRSVFRSAPAPLRAAVRSLLGPAAMQALRGRQRPFITVRLSDDGRGRFLLCRSQLDRDGFSEQLGRASCAVGGSRLLDAVRYVLQNELYQAAFAFFDWIHRPGSDAKAVVSFGPGEKSFSGYLDHPVIDMCGGAERNSAQRGRDLAKLFDAMEATAGNDQTRFWFLQALAFALSRHFGLLGRLEAGLDYVRRAMRLGESFMPLETCRHVLELKQRGLSVPPPLEKFAGTDSRTLDPPPAIPSWLQLGAIQSLRAPAGQQPFITVRLSDDGPGQFLLYRGRPDRGAFLEKLASASRAVGGSPLLDAVRYVLEYELYQAAFALFDWVHRPAADANAVVFSFGWGYPIIDVCGGAERGSAQRARDLANLFDVMEAAAGHTQDRFGFLEALAFALSRHFGLLGRFETGLDYVQRAIRLGEGFMHLETCRHVLDLKQRGLPVPKRLEKFAGADNHALDDRTCTHPYTRFDINPTGEVHICCSMWAPVSLGNVVSQDVEAVLNSTNARKIRQSVLDGSFRYCNHVGCSVMVRDELPKKTDPAILADPVMSSAVAQGETRTESVRDLTFALDYTCNLSCPSCRTERMIQKESAHSAERSTVDEKLRPLLPHIQTLYLNPAGEFLASRPSRRLLSSIDPQECPNLRIDLISNGTLFSEPEWQKFSNVHGLVRSVRISVDAASAPTFETIRRGGKWPGFLDNVRYVGRLRKDGQLKEFYLAFTYQVGNFREMKDFVALAEDVGADVATFQALQKTEAMTDAEYFERAVHRLDHPLYGEFLQIIADDVFEKSNVHTDFDGVPDLKDQRALVFQ